MKILFFVFLALPSVALWHINSLFRFDILHQNLSAANADSDQELYQVIISEIMADPYPSVLLPDAEYIELYNRSENVVDISGWKIVFGNRIKAIPNATIEAKSYLIVCDENQKNNFSPYGKTLTVVNMPSILNEGQTITIKNTEGKIIHTVSFSNKWYNSSYKTEGGWSLEIIDPDNPCGRRDNWNESNDYRGGTPGTINSVYAANRDVQQPSLLRATFVSSVSAALHFSESMDSTSMNKRGYYSVSPIMFQPQMINPVAPDYNTLIMTFTESFKADQRYRIMVLDSLRDCAGNMLKKNAVVDFALPQIADRFDIVFNEVLFDASDHVYEYIELYNRSLKVIDLASLSLALLDPYGIKINKLISLKDHAYLLFPDSYLVITSDNTKLPDITRYYWQHCIVEVPDLFSLSDDHGVIEIYNIQQQSIDKFTYSREMHFDLLSTSEGVAIERIDPDGNTNDWNNWHSASESSGYATPGYQNSQMLTYDEQSEVIQIIPEVFSPDNDGFDDCTTICLNCNEPGYVANIVVFDALGRKIKSLANNLLVGTGNVITWDGTDLQNNVAETGIYLIYIELYHASGRMHSLKKAITLVRTLH